MSNYQRNANQRGSSGSSDSLYNIPGFGTGRGRSTHPRPPFQQQPEFLQEGAGHYGEAGHHDRAFGRGLLNFYLAHHSRNEQSVNFIAVGGRVEDSPDELKTSYHLSILGETGYSGSTYTLFNGIYGYDTNIFLKRAPLSRRALVENDNAQQLLLQPSEKFPLFKTMSENSTFTFTVQSRYEHSCDRILSWYANSNSHSNQIDNFDAHAQQEHHPSRHPSQKHLCSNC